MESIVDKILTNNKLDLSATISRKSVKEILSGEAAGKSFELKSHLKAAANVDTLFSNAIKNGTSNLTRTRIMRLCKTEYTSMRQWSMTTESCRLS